MREEPAEIALDDVLLKQQLQAAQLELEALNELVLEVPALMEERFKRELAHQLALNQRLVQERFQLTAMVDSLITAQTEVPQPLTSMKLPSFCWPWFSAIKVPPQVLMRSLVIGFGVALFGLLLVALRSHIRVFLQQSAVVVQPTTPVLPPQVAQQTHPVAGTSESLVELSADDATWVEVRDRQGQVLLQDTLQGNDQRRIRLRSGLEIYAARPELLSFRVDEGEWQTWPAAFLRSRLLLLTPRLP